MLAVLVLYILSLGPVLYFTMGRGLPPEQQRMIEAFYEPIEWLQQTPLEKPLTAYHRWCGELGLRKRASSEP